ncbi:hypothetical protein GCM10010201_26550 [Pilimelia columellifera subsp. columellifera]|uniref:Uncharacterized protein n=1 Tax=Pilimelia columellifera subsp. columellifera TaxID=706583 RepID=A0ABN3NMW5_9ACTN
MARHQALDFSNCQRVRWQFTMAVPEQRLNLDDITVVRTENGTLVPMRQSQTSGAVRLTDQRVDDGQLCRGRNVTAVYTVRVPAARTTGTVSVSVEALDLTGQKLGAGSTNINVIAAGEAPRPTKPAPSPNTADDDAGAGAGAGDPIDANIGDGRLASGNLPDSIPVAWLAVGVLTMIFSAGWLITLYRRAR